MEGALAVFAGQAHAALSFPQHGLGDAASNGLRGSYSEDDALEHLLAGSPYHFERAGPHAYRIVLKQQAEAQPPVEEIIVTGARRPVSLGALPRSLTHLEDPQIDAAPQHSLVGLSGDVSGLASTNVGSGRNKLTLRGVSDGALTGRAQSSVGIYFDSVRLTYAAPDPDLQLVDINHIDILRGPQGALYGAGSIGGIVAIQSNPVDLQNTSGSLRLGAESTVGGAAGYNTEAVFNAPIIDQSFGVRAVFYDQSAGGWLDDALTHSENGNRTQREGLRVQALWQMSPNWSLTAFGISQTINSPDSQYLARDGEDFVRATHIREPHDSDFFLAGQTLRGETRWGSIESTTAYVRHEINSRYDATGAFAALGVDPSLARPLDQSTALNILVHETRLTSPDTAPVPWFLGFFYSDGDNKDDVTLRDGAANVWASQAYHEARDDGVDELAVFGEATWPLAPTLTLTTGLRLFQLDVKTTSQITESALGLSDNFIGKKATRGAAPDIRLSYRPDRNTLFYVAASEGFRGGGFNTGGPVGVAFTSTATQPSRNFSNDDLWSFEAGMRLTSLDRRLEISSAAFLELWRNIQTDSLIANNFTYTGNVGRGRIFGAEAEISYRLSDHLTVAANLLVNEPELNRVLQNYPDATRGSGLPGAPELSAGATLRYDGDLRWGALSGRQHGVLSLSYVCPSALTFGPGPNTGAYTVANVEFGIDAGDWSLSVYGENLFNADGITFAVGNPYAPAGQLLVTPLRPVTFGVSLRRSF